MVRDECGVVTTELVLITPALIAMLLFVAFAGRLTLARSDVGGAARDAARAASLARSAPAAIAAADSAARANLERSGVPCSDRQVSVDTSNFTAGGTVAVDLTCTVTLSGYSIIGVGDQTVTARSVEVVDTYQRVDP